MIVAALFVVPMFGLLLIRLLPGRSGRWTIVTVVAESAILGREVTGGSARLAGDTSSVLGSDLLLRPSGALAIAVALLVVIVALVGAHEEGAPPGLETAGILGLASVALVALTSANQVLAALVLMTLVAALALAVPSRVGVSDTRPIGQRFVIWLALASSALLLSGAFDRFYTREPGPGLLGPAAALGVVGVGIALAALPLSFWLAPLAEQSPLAAGLATGTFGAATMAILAAMVGANPWLLDDPTGRLALAAAGGIAGALSALLALGEIDPARSLAYLISAGSDFALGALALTLPADSTIFVLIIGAQSLAAALGFTCLGAARGQLAGLVRRRAPLAIGLSVATLSLVGLPLTAGSVGRWLLASSLVGPHPFFVVSMVLTTAIGGLAVWRSFGTMFESSMASSEPWRPLDLAALTVSAGLVVAGFFPGPILTLLAG